jgi:hypothetical protein
VSCHAELVVPDWLPLNFIREKATTNLLPAALKVLSEFFFFVSVIIATKEKQTKETSMVVGLNHTRGLRFPRKS